MNGLEVMYLVIECNVLVRLTIGHRSIRRCFLVSSHLNIRSLPA